MKVVIHPGSQPHELVRRAASELQRYIRELFGFTPRIGASRAKTVTVIDLDIDDHLAAEQYTLRRRNPRRMELRGGSPVAVQWAVYELIEQWGVTYLVKGDVMPDSAGPFRLPPIDEKRSPVFEARAFRIINEMLNSGVLWTLKDHERLFDQLIKLRFNTVYAAAYPFQPWCHWSYRGIERSEVDLVYGFRHNVHERSIGQEHFGGLGHYTNPDFKGAQTYEQRLAAGKRLMHGMIDAAHARGLRFVLAHIPNAFPEEIKIHLPRFSKQYRIPKTSMKGTQAFRIGLEYDAGNSRFGELLTPLNPAYIEMAESWIAAHLEEYPDIDGLCLSGVEFPPPSGGVERCWNDLDKRHGLSPQFTYKKLMHAGKRVKMIGDPNRGVREAQGAIATMRLLDILLNERTRVSELLKPGAKLYGNFISEVPMPVLPKVFDADRFEFLSTVDYLPADVADRIDVMDFTRGTDFKAHLITTVNDDNVGFLPQFNTTQLHRIVRGMKKFGVKGFWFRQFDISEYEPVMAYLAEAGWDRTASPTKTYRRQVGRICGEAAVEPMLRAYRLLEKTLDDANAAIGVGFMMPHLVAKYWRNGLEKPNPKWLKTMDRLIAAYRRIEPVVAKALAASEPRGRQYAGDVLAFVQFARLYCLCVRDVHLGGIAYAAVEAMDQPSKARKTHTIDQYNEQLCLAAKLLAGALENLEQATRLWADTVRDATDIGSLLGLNVYGLDWLRGKADEIRLRSEIWVFEI